MRYKQKNKKGVALILALFFAVMLAGLAGITYIRSVNEANLTQRFLDSSQAFYEAEAGLAYAYSEASSSGFEWYTHKDKDTKVTVTETLSVNNGAMKIEFRSPVPHVVPNSSIHGTTGCYQVSGRGFSVKAFPDQKSDGTYTGAITVLSQATVNGVSRTVELRIGQESAYKYFFFFPSDYTFETSSFDGRNFGGIHVNGTVFFKGNPSFKYLTALTSGSEVEGKGYIKRVISYGYSGLDGTYGAYPGTFGDASGNVPYTNSNTDPHTLDANLYAYAQNRCYTGTTYFTAGAYGSGTEVGLSYYLSGAGAPWDWQKYPKANNITTAHYTISDANLKNTALYEITGHQGSVEMFDAAKTIDAGGVPVGTEKEVFTRLLNNDPTLPVEITWDTYWQKWRTNHQSDYSAFHTAGTYTEGTGASSRDWERRFFAATYDWDVGADGIPNGLNREWWTDLSYGNGRTQSGIAPAQVELTETGEPFDGYFLNTEKQSQAWTNWLNPAAAGVPKFNELGENKTRIQDKSQGGQYVDPGDIISSSTDPNSNQLLQKALNGGIYIGWQKNPAYWEVWRPQYLAAYWACRNGTVSSGCVPTNVWCCVMYARTIAGFPPPVSNIYHSPDEFLGGCYRETQFYNSAHPNRYDAVNGEYGPYVPSTVLVIDVHAFKEKIDTAKAKDQATRTPEEERLANFNGILYVNYQSLEPGNPGSANNDLEANSVMLVNGERLPDGGLSIVSNNNVMVKGNYNLDPDGCNSAGCEKNRNPDDAAVLNNVRALKAYATSIDDPATPDIDETGLKWQPAEVITTRAVYTLSENFPEPSYMPMAPYHAHQYLDENDYLPAQDYVTGDQIYPTNDWVPTVAETRAEKSRVNTWLQYSGIAPPASGKWTRAWIDANWSGSAVYALDTDGNGTKDTYILGQDLRDDVYYSFISHYQNTYAYSAVHGADGQQNLATPSLVNTVNTKHIYNTALVTPYAATTYALESWVNTERIINGAFVQLPDAYAASIPLGERYFENDSYGRAKRPTYKTYNYETRFGRGASQADRPRSNLTFGAEGSWREVREGSF